MRRLRARLRSEDGFGLLELMMTLVILSIGIAGLLTIFLASASSLARSGRQGTATVILDRTFEYYRRGPWGNIRLVASGPGGSFGVTDSNVTGDSIYTGQCSSCPVGGSSVLVDDNTPPSVTFGTTTITNGSTCNVGQGTQNPDTDSTQPITDCLAEATVFGADNMPYRVYTYMKYGCGAPQWLSTSTYASGDPVQYNGLYYTSAQASNTNHSPPTTTPTWWATTTCPVDYGTKLVTIVVRLLSNDGTTLADSSAKGVLAKQTVVYSYGSFTTVS